MRGPFICFLLDMVWWLVMTGVLVVLAIAMTTWLVVGPWRLIDRIKRHTFA